MEWKQTTDLYIKPTDTHEYLELSSCHVHHSKKSICSENRFFRNRCNHVIDVEVTMKKWLDNKL